MDGEKVSGWRGKKGGGGVVFVTMFGDGDGRFQSDI